MSDNEENRYAEIARRDFERGVYKQCAVEDAERECRLANEKELIRADKLIGELREVNAVLLLLLKDFVQACRDATRDDDLPQIITAKMIARALAAIKKAEEVR